MNFSSFYIFVSVFILQLLNKFAVYGRATVGSHCPYPVDNGTLCSPRVTDLGEWGEFETCPQGTFVMGMKLKTEPAQGPGDDTALNGISFMCGVTGDSQKVLHRQDRQIQSHVGPWGTWGVSYECPNGAYAVGFQLRSEADQKGQDDTGANNLRIFCSGSDRPRIHYLEGSGLSWGSWSADRFCPYEWAICALKTQVQSSQGHASDDTALNNLDVKCCPVN